MNIYITAIIFSIGISLIKNGAAATTCSFCSGVTVDESYVIPESDGATCGLVITTAAMFEEGSDDCDGLRLLETFCCPSDNQATTCVFCDGVTELGYNIISDGMTCRDAAQIIPLLAQNSVECTTFKLLESVCCPSVATGPESPCSFCKGLQVLENVYYEGTSCATGAALVAALESTSEECAFAQTFQSICCPRAPTVACSFCAGATTMTPGDVVQGELSCEEVADYAAWLESTAQECSIIQQEEAICCPDAVPSPNPSSGNEPITTPPPTTSNAPPVTEPTTPTPTPNAPPVTEPTTPTPTSNESTPQPSASSIKPTNASSSSAFAAFTSKCLIVSVTGVAVAAYFAIA